MDNLSVLEECYKKYINDIGYWVPDGIIEIDLHTLNVLDLLHYFDPKNVISSDAFTRYFHVIESPEKITLINDHFVVWIVPSSLAGIPKTFGLIAKNLPQNVHLELVFSASGVYNTSGLVLRILEKFLKEIQENEEIVKKFNANP